MRRILRPLTLVVALLSFESTALAGRDRCAMAPDAAPSGMAESGDADCAHGATHSGESESDHAPSHGHDGQQCLVAQSCASAVLPAVRTLGPAILSAALAAPNGVPTMIPGSRPAPAVPPPRA